MSVAYQGHFEIGAFLHSPGPNRGKSRQAQLWFWLALALATSAAPPSAAQYFAPYNPELTKKNLASLLKDTQQGVKFSDYDAQELWNSMYVDCSVFGADDRYIFYDTLFRLTLEITRAFSETPAAYLKVDSTPTGIIVDAITPARIAGGKDLIVRLAVIDRSGRVLYSTFTEQGIMGACQGAQGPVYVDGVALERGLIAEGDDPHKGAPAFAKLEQLSSGQPSSLFDLVRLQPYSTAWTTLLKHAGKIDDWIATLSGPGGPAVFTVVRGDRYVVGSICKAHACESDQLYVLFGAGGKYAKALILSDEHLPRWLGNPNAEQQRILMQSASDEDH